MKLLAFTGKMGSGKSTAVGLLHSLASPSFHNIKFAGPLYDMQEYIYRRIHKSHTRPPEFIKDRKLLQWLGTEWGRETIDKNIWVNVWKGDVIDASRHYPSQIILCDDCRFDNEAVAVRELGGHVVQITTDKSAERINTGAGITNHVSEIGVDKNLISYTIINNGSVDDLRNALLEMNAKLKIWNNQS